MEKPLDRYAGDRRAGHNRLQGESAARRRASCLSGHSGPIGCAAGASGNPAKAQPIARLRHELRSAQVSQRPGGWASTLPGRAMAGAVFEQEASDFETLETQIK